MCGPGGVVWGVWSEWGIVQGVWSGGVWSGGVSSPQIFFFFYLFIYFNERTPPPPPKQTQAYGQRAAGTHPTGMHSCLQLILNI